MNIAIDCRPLHHERSGIGRYTYQLTRALLKKNNGHNIFLYGNPFNLICQIPSENELDQYYGRKIPFPFRKMVRIISGLLVQMKRDLHIDVILWTNFLGEFSSRYKSIITIHDMAHHYYPEHIIPGKGRLLQRYLAKHARRADLILCVSENTKKDILRFCDIPPNRVFVVPNGFSCKVEDLGGCSENKYGKYILYVSSSHYPYKNLSLLFDAYKNISSRFPHRLIIVGKSVPRFSYSVERKIADLGLSDKVILLENLMDHEMASLYRHADLFVYPSLYEGFGIPPLEAMAFCVPVVASNAASIPEVCGKAALYINPQNVDSITEGMYKGLTDRDLRQRLVTEGLERTKLFSWEKTAQAIITVCQNVLALA